MEEGAATCCKITDIFTFMNWCWEKTNSRAAFSEWILCFKKLLNAGNAYARK